MPSITLTWKNHGLVALSKQIGTDTSECVMFLSASTIWQLEERQGSIQPMLCVFIGFEKLFFWKPTTTVCYLFLERVLYCVPTRCAVRCTRDRQFKQSFLAPESFHPILPERKLISHGRFLASIWKTHRAFVVKGWKSMFLIRVAQFKENPSIFSRTFKVSVTNFQVFSN